MSIEHELRDARHLCEALGTEYDERAVRWLAAMERRLDRLRLERFGHFVGILNAIENHVEEGDGDPTVVRLLGEALLALAAVHRLPESTVKYLTQTLGQLHSHVAMCRESRKTR